MVTKDGQAEQILAQLWRPGEADETFRKMLRDHVERCGGSENAALRQLVEGVRKEYDVSLSRATVRNWLRGSQPKMANALPVIRYLLNDKTPG